MKTILIVDDEPAARYGLRRALESNTASLKRLRRVPAKRYSPKSLICYS